MLADLISVKDRVRYCLVADPPCRDCDRRLWVQCMVKFYGLKQALELNPMWNKPIDNFIHWFMQDTIPSMESVRRCRQKLQEDYPHLRGLTYKKRHQEAEGVRQWAKPGL